MPISERKKEICRRRHRRRKLEHLKQKLQSANKSEQQAIIEKVRLLTPGYDEILKNWGVTDQ